jgi:ABC-type glycerol-3-phosphate transport system substrate-binding protein
MYSKKKMLMFLVVALLISTVSMLGLAAKRKELVVAYPGWDSAEQEKAVSALVKEFNAKNPDLHIALQNYPWAMYRDKIVVQLKAKSGPDLGYNPMYWIPAWYRNGFISDLTKYIPELNITDWYEGSWGSSLYGSKYYSIPDRREPDVVYYNADLFEKAGIKEFPSTMDEFLAAAKKLTTQDVAGFGLAMASHSTLPSQILNFLYAFGVDPITADGKGTTFLEPETIKAVQFYIDLYRKYNVTQKSATGDSRDEIRRLFMAGKVAMMIDGLWAAGTFDQLAPDLNWKTGVFPQVSGLERSCLAQGWDWVIYSHSNYPDEAFRFIKFMTQPENMAKAVVTLPARKTASTVERFADPFYDIWFEALKYASPPPKTEYYNDIFQYVMGDVLQSIVIQNVPVEKALEVAAKRSLDILNQ